MQAGDPAGWSPTGCVAEPPPPDPSRRRIPGSPAPPPAPGPPSPLPRRPSQCLNLLLIPALPKRPPPLPSLLPGPSSPAPGWAQACAYCAPHPLLAQLANPSYSREEAAAGAPQAPPALGPSREAGRPARPGPRWVSAAAGDGWGLRGRRRRERRRLLSSLQAQREDAPASPLLRLARGVPAAAPTSWPRLGPPGIARHCGPAGRAPDPGSFSPRAAAWGPAGWLIHRGPGHALLALGAAADRGHAFDRAEPGAASARRPLP